MYRVRCDRQPGAGRFSLPVADARRRPDRFMAARRCGAVARQRRYYGREREREPWRPALGPPSAPEARTGPRRLRGTVTRADLDQIGPGHCEEPQATKQSRAEEARWARDCFAVLAMTVGVRGAT